MVDLHSRVEVRPGLAGSGMNSDPEKISEIQNQWDQGVRTYGQTKKTKFKEVIKNNKADSLEKSQEGDQGNKTEEPEKNLESKNIKAQLQPQLHWVRV